jgi:hypothetical protein
LDKYIDLDNNYDQEYNIEREGSAEDDVDYKLSEEYVSVIVNKKEVDLDINITEIDVDSSDHFIVREKHSLDSKSSDLCKSCIYVHIVISISVKFFKSYHVLN